MITKGRRKAIVIAVIAIVVFLFLHRIGATKYLGLDFLKAQAVQFKQLTEKHYLIAALGYILVVTAMAAAALPCFAPAAILSGYLFGAFLGFLYALTALTAGSAVSFLLARYLLVNLLRERYAQQLAHFKERIDRHGYMYLIILQLLAVVPYVIINSVAALAQVPFTTFIVTTILGSSPLIMMYALAGGQLTTMNSLQDILSPQMLIVLLLLVLLVTSPLIIKKWHNHSHQGE